MRQWEKGIFDKFWPDLAATPGIGERNAKKLVDGFLKQAVSESKSDGTFSRPANYGDILLSQDKTNQETQRLLLIKETEGVINEDILWWWNLHEVERRILNNIDIFHRTALYFEYYKHQGLSQEQATKKLFKFRPKWGFILEDSTDKDRPLPPELMDRVNRYVIKRFETDPDKYKSECERSTSFNALVRKEIRAKNL